MTNPCEITVFRGGQNRIFSLVKDIDISGGALQSISGCLQQQPCRYSTNDQASYTGICAAVTEHTTQVFRVYLSKSLVMQCVSKMHAQMWRLEYRSLHLTQWWELILTTRIYILGEIPFSTFSPSPSPLITSVPVALS